MKGRFGYFGTLTFDQNAVIYNGALTKFNLSNEPISLSIPINEVTNISIGWQKIIITTRDQTYHFKTCFLYDGTGIGPITSNLGLLGLIIERKKYKNLEAETAQLQGQLMSNSLYAQKTTPTIDGVKKSSMSLAAIVTVLVILTVFFVWIFHILSGSSTTGKSDYADCIVKNAGQSTTACDVYKK